MTILPRAACLTLLPALAACGGGRGDGGDMSGVVVAVSVQPARLETLRDVARFTGIVAPAAAADFTATAPEAAVIAEVPDEGQLVTAGQLIVKFEVPAVAAAIAQRESDVTAAAAKVSEAQAEATRVDAMFKQGLVAKTRYDAARAAAAAAESELAQARANLESARAQDAGAGIRAPFTGIVQSRFRGPGDVAGLDDPILRLVDPTRLQIVVRIPTEEATRVLPGQASTVRAAAGDELAVVARKTAPEDGPSTEIRLDLAGPTALLIDMEVQVEVVLDVRPNVIVVPSAAVQRPDNAATFVWLATDDDRAERREVRVGLMADGMTEILSGLADGDVVITAGIAQLTDGVAIQKN